jgi:hypothetical protein
VAGSLATFPLENLLCGKARVWAEGMPETYFELAPDFMEVTHSGVSYVRDIRAVSGWLHCLVRPLGVRQRCSGRA